MRTFGSTNTSAYQSNSVNIIDPNELFIRDTEINRLNMRIHLLEQHSQVSHNSNNSNDNKLSNQEYEESIMRIIEVNNNSAKDEQIKKLDSLVKNEITKSQSLVIIYISLLIIN
jgi:hypothetical protein